MTRRFGAGGNYCEAWSSSRFASRDLSVPAAMLEGINDALSSIATFRSDTGIGLRRIRQLADRFRDEPE
jgi:hypothetical protein